MASAFKVLSVPRCCRSRCLGRCPGGKCCRLRSFSALPLGRRTAAGKGCRMRREWDPEDLLACWTLMDPDRQLLANKAGATRLGFAVLLKFFELEARFPRHGGEVPPVAVAYLAQQVGVEAAEFTRYGWSGRAVKYHRAQIRQALGFRESTVADEDRLAAWLAAEVCPVELREEALREAVAAWCRAERIEPPGASRLNRGNGATTSTADSTCRPPPPTSPRSAPPRLP